MATRGLSWGSSMPILKEPWAHNDANLGMILVSFHGTSLISWGMLDGLIEFLGHWIKEGKLMMDETKVRAIQGWKAPTKTEEYQQVFNRLKQVILEEPLMVLADHTKPFEVHTDASDFAIGGVSMQGGYPIAYESRKLNDTE
ncbi:uncharacterized protein E5676_scaffold83G001540 [Cucumis melo var. makuwa]|uniref:Reverse transcriptase/retrotransposon-derived protein RNase H-like domain-containing protein n=1 Tax=Cucumis melo var. makuwa TaxID=1194695 RepID=A0A5D3C0K9_CUCMM|nr:uncharacterized protein E5676_scaffold83G001540 [Cucumis melo var. makuwa]